MGLLSLLSSAIALYNVLVIVIITCNLFNTFIHVHVNSSTIHVQFQYPQQMYVNMIYIISNQNVLYYMKYGGKTFPSPLQFLKNKPLQSRGSKTSIMFPKKKDYHKICMDKWLLSLPVWILEIFNCDSLSSLPYISRVPWRYAPNHLEDQEACSFPARERKQPSISWRGASRSTVGRF